MQCNVFRILNTNLSQLKSVLSKFKRGDSEITSITVEETLKDRRIKQRLPIRYKIHYGLVAVDKDKCIKQSSRVYRHSHDQAYEIPKTGPDY